MAGRRKSCYGPTCKRVACDALAIAALIAVMGGVLAAKRAGRVVRRGFFCDDESIRLPFREETVPNWALVLAVAAIPVLAVSGWHCTMGQEAEVDCWKEISLGEGRGQSIQLYRQSSSIDYIDNIPAGWYIIYDSTLKN